MLYCNSNAREEREIFDELFLVGERYEPTARVLLGFKDFFCCA
jgi:hypothetical protein